MDNLSFFSGGDSENVMAKINEIIREQVRVVGVAEMKRIYHERRERNENKREDFLTKVKKKHREQMTDGEVQIVKNKMLPRNDVAMRCNVTDHAYQRIDETIEYGSDGKTKEEILVMAIVAVIKGELVEYKITDYNEERIVLRYPTYTSLGDICVVYSIPKNLVITIWFNNNDDDHETLDLSLYDADLEIK